MNPMRRSLDMKLRPLGVARILAHRDFCACTVLAVVVLVLLGRAPLTGRVLAPTDSIFLTPFFADQKPAHFQHPANPLLFDQVYQFVPWRRFAWERLRAGRVPLWNPYSHAGAPLVATMGGAVFYPINLLLLPLPFEQTFAWSAILKLWIAGTLTYLLARSCRLGQEASLISALAFMLSSYLIVWLGHPHTNVAIWLPGILLADELFLTASNRAERLRYSALLAILVGVQFTGGHAETSADVLLAAAFYHVLRGIQVVLPAPGSRRAKAARLLLLPSAAVVLGLGLASIQLVPFLEWLPLSAEYHARASKQFTHMAPWRYLFFLPLAIYPNLYSNPTWPLPPYRSLLPWGQNFNEDVLYVGILPLILAVMALLRWRRRPPQVTVWAVLGGIALGRALHFPVLDWLNQVPVLSLGNPHRQRLVWCLSIAVLAGFGAQAWWGHTPGREERVSRYWLRLNVSVVVLGVLLAIIGIGIIPLLKGTLTTFGRHVAEAEFAVRGDGGAFPLSHYYERSDEAVAKLMWSFRIGNISMYLPALISAAALAATFWMLRRPLQRWAALRLSLLSLTILDLLAFAWSYNPLIPARTFYPRPRVVSPMAQDRSLYRFTATGMDLFPDAQMMYRLSDVRSCDFSTQWFITYIGMIPETFRWISYGTTFQDSRSPLLRVLNLKYVFSTSPHTPTGAGADIVFSSGASRLWRLQHVQPRSFMVYDALLTRDDSEAVRAIRAAPEAVYRRVVLSGAAPVHPPMPSASESTAGARSSVSVLRYVAEESVWKVRTEHAGYLVTTDAYYPGWRAYVDGVRTPVYRANVAFRAIEVPQGEHRIVYRYEPSWLPPVVALELLSSLILVLGFVWAARSGGVTGGVREAMNPTEIGPAARSVEAAD